MAASATIATIGAGLGIHLVALKVYASRPTLAGSAEYADMINEIPFFHYATGNRYLLMCLASTLKVSGIELCPATRSSLPCSL